MPQNKISQRIKDERLAAKSFEKNGHHQFRDCVTFCSNGKVYFERYCYGEAAGLVCAMWANEIDNEGNILWDYDACPYSKKNEAAKQINKFEDGKLFFDNKQIHWECTQNYKTFPKAGLGFFKMLFS